MSTEVRRWAYGTEELPLGRLLAAFALELRFEPQSTTPSLGARFSATAGEIRFAGVTLGGTAHEAGLSAGDVLVAIDDLRVLPGRLDTLLSRYRAGDVVRVSAFRGDILQTRLVTLEGAPRRAVLAEMSKSTKTARRLRENWLRGDEDS